jgi:Lipopolysaccharide-assembly
VIGVKRRRTIATGLCIAAYALLAGCGYHVGGQADLIPKSVKSICIPPFKNRTKQYRMVDTLPNAIGREFKARTKYVIVNDPLDADAILSGEVTNVLIVPSIYDPTTGTASAAFVIAYMNITLSERVSKKVLYTQLGLECRDNYEIAPTPAKYFDESDFAVDRLSKKIAAQVVSAVVEAF